MNDLGILAELRLEDGDAHEAAAKWIETPPGNPADQPKRITALSETVAMLVTKIGDAIAHLPGAEKVFRRGLVARDPAELATALGVDGALISGEMSRETAEKVAQAVRKETGASHALAVLIEVDDGPDRIDFGGSIHLAIASDEGTESRRSRIYGGRDWVRLGAVELGLDCLRRYLQDLPVTERTDFERV